MRLIKWSISLIVFIAVVGVGIFACKIEAEGSDTRYIQYKRCKIIGVDKMPCIICQDGKAITCDWTKYSGE